MKESNYTKRILVIVPIGEIDAANSVAVSAIGHEIFSVDSPTMTKTVSSDHYCASAVVTELMIADIINHGASIVGAKIFYEPSRNSSAGVLAQALDAGYSLDARNI